MLAIAGGTVHTIVDGVRPAHTVLIREGRFEAVVPDGTHPPDCEIVDVSGQVVLPGLIDARTSIGLFGDGSGFQNADHEELTDPDSAWARAIDALNPADPAFAEARATGVTTVLVGPGTTNVAGGLSAVVKTAGSSVDDMLVYEPAGLQIGLGRPPVTSYRESNSLWTRMGVVALLRERLTAARVHQRKCERAPEAQASAPAADHVDAPEEDLRLGPYVALLGRQFPARVRVATAEDAWTALRLADEFGLDLVLEQLTEGHLADLPQELSRRGIPCVLGPMMKAAKTPETQALTFQTAVVLSKAGVDIALSTGHPSRPIRYLCLEAALAVRAGLDQQTALRAITLHAAAAIGLSDRLGSIERGKDADLAVLDGDPLLPSARVTHTFVQGQLVYQEPSC
jgi:imidazolonepropionase-like amidohydrolase